MRNRTLKYTCGWRFSLTILGLAVMIFFTTCTTEKWHRTLTFFFDGVPDTTSKQLVKANDSVKHADTSNVSHANVNNAPSQIIHPPYKERNCDACHQKDQKGKFVAEQPDLCYNCHDNFKTKYKSLHAPVEAGSCTECHSPHYSKNKKLLIRQGQDLCLYCHDKQDVFKIETHKDIGETSCTECHNPHGGEDNYLLR